MTLLHKAKTTATPNDRLDYATWQLVGAREALAGVRPGDDIWADDGDLVTDDIRRTAEISGLTPGQLAGALEMYRRVRAVRGAEAKVAEARTALYAELDN